jgi:hypothetical protein
LKVLIRLRHTNKILLKLSVCMFASCHVDDLDKLHQASPPAMGFWHNNQPLNWLLVHAQNKINVV